MFESAPWRSASMRVESLTSPRNPLLKNVRQAIARGALTEEGFAVAEGFHLLEEALLGACEVQVVLVAESLRSSLETRMRDLAGPRVVAIPDALFREMSSTETAQGVMALVRPPAWTLDQLFAEERTGRGGTLPSHQKHDAAALGCAQVSQEPLVVVLDGVQDPGNAGAVVRAAEAFGGSGVAFLKGSVNPHNPKCLRASAGSLFRVPCIHGVEASVLLDAVARRRLDLYAAVAAGEKVLAGADLTRRCALIIGSEGRGVNPKLRSAAIDLRIPTSGVESLNAAVAAGILLYEARRQRTVKSA
ncbi:MAG: TrmH family RNA methyltransferase, partial [Roseiarcus sp.]